MSRVRNVSIYQKIIITFLLVIIPLYAFSMYLNELSTDALRREILGSMSARIHFYRESLERELDNIYSLQNNLALDQKFQRFGVAGNYVSNVERRDLFNDIQRQLFLIQSSNQFIEEVRVHFMEMDTTVTASVLYSELDKLSVEPLLRTSQDQPLLYNDGKLYLRMTYPQSLTLLGEQKQPLFLIETEISVVALEQTLSGFSVNGPEIVSLTGDDASWAISNRNHDPGTTEDDGNYLIVSEASGKYKFSLMSYAPEDVVIKPVKEFQNWFWWLSLLTLVIVLLFSYSINRMLQRPIRALIHSFRRVEAGQFEVRLERNAKDEFHYLYSRFNMMVEQINHLINTVYEQRIRRQQAELKHLQSQINPHFLYNSLFVLHQMVVIEDYHNLEHFSKNLSDYFKVITRSAVQDVSLEEEVKYAKNYVSIQEFRFSNRVKVFFEHIPEEVRELEVPRLILQPVIENAFHHGLKNTIQQGIIQIGFRIVETMLIITVEDNGEGLTEERMEQLKELLDRKSDSLYEVESTGLINVHQRLLLKFGSPAGIGLQLKQGGGLEVRIRVLLGGGMDDVSRPGGG